MNTPAKLDAEMRAQIDQYFAGRASSDDARRLFAACEENESAKKYFERHQLLAQLDPKGGNAKRRISASLGFAAPSENGEARGLRSWLPGLSVAGAFAAALFIFVLPDGAGPGKDAERQGTERQGSDDDDGFTARGPVSVTSDARARVVAYRVLPGSESDTGSASKTKTAKLGAELSADSELAFAYANPEQRRRLMIWGQDERGEVFWYHPAWTDPGKNPPAVEIEHADALKELPAAIAHDLQGTSLTLFALFTDERLTVQAVEAALKAKAPLPGELLELAKLSVRPPQ